MDIPALYTIVPGAHFRERARASSVPFFAAKIISGQNNPRAVFAGLEELRKLYPDTYYLDFFQAQALLETGRVEAAIPLLNRALDSNPNDQDIPGILTYLGLAHKDLENYDQAIELLSRSAELDDERQDTFNLLGFCYFKTKQHEKAIKAFEKVLKIDPGSGIDHANIGTNYREMGRTEEAIRYYKIAFRLDPALDWVRDNIAKLSG